MRTLHEEANAKPRANILSKNHVLEGVGVRRVGGKCGASKGVVCAAGHVFGGACGR